MSFYFIVFTILSIESFCEIFVKLKPLTKKLMEYGTVAGMIFISAIRCSGAGDYLSYRFIFNTTDIDISLFTSITRDNLYKTEIGYNFLNYLAKLISTNYQFFIFIEAVIVNILLYIFCTKIMQNHEKAGDKNYCLTIFFCMWCLNLYNIIIVRQTIAVMLCFFSMKYIRRNDFPKFLICVLLGFTLHRTCLMWGGAYYLYHLKTERRSTRRVYFFTVFMGLVLGTILLNPIALYIPGIVGEKLRTYIHYGIRSYGELYNVFFIIAKSMMNIILIFVLMLLIFNRFKDDRRFVGCFNLYTFGVVVMLGAYTISNQFARVATPFNMLSVFLLTYIFRLNSTRNKRFAVFVVFTAYMALRLYVSVSGNEFTNYGYETIYGTF